MNDVYSRLREFTHTLPERYPLTGVKMKILNKLFSPEDSRKIEHGETFLQYVHRYFGI